MLPGTPTMCQYKTHADAKSLYNTPPAYGIYICGKVFKWLKKRGGLQAMKEYNEKKAKILYDFLDESKLFKGTVVKEDRSLMNVPLLPVMQISMQNLSSSDSSRLCKSEGPQKCRRYESQPFTMQCR